MGSVNVKLSLAWWLRWYIYPWVVIRLLWTGRPVTSEEAQALVMKAIRVKVVKPVLKA